MGPRKGSQLVAHNYVANPTERKNHGFSTPHWKKSHSKKPNFSFVPLPIAKESSLRQTKSVQPVIEELWTVENVFEEKRLQDVLGFSRDFVKEFLECWEEAQYDECPCRRWTLVDLLNNKFEACSLELSIIDILKQIGFNDETAQSISGHIESHPTDRSLWDWIQKYVNSKIDSKVVKTPEWSRKRNFEFEIQTKYEQKERSGRHFRTITVEDAKKKCSQNPSTKFWYHATTAYSAETILQCGILLRQGDFNRTFSNKDGFYLTDNLENAIQIAEENFAKSSVILLFNFSKSDDPMKSYGSEESIDLRDESTEDRLRKILNYFSEPYPENNPDQTTHGLDSDFEDKIQYIIGPRVWFKNPKFPNEIQIDYESKVTHLCLRQKDIKSKFENFLQREVVLVDN